MSTASVPQQGLHRPSTGRNATALTIGSYVVNLAYLPWFWVMFGAGYWVSSWFGIDPEQEWLTDQGFLGWAAAIGFGLVAALPSWIGAWLATRARRAGARTAAAVALVLNLLAPVGWVLLMVLNG